MALSNTQLGKRVALAGVGVSGGLSLTKIIIGLLGGSTSVVADGVESAGDVLASGVVWLGVAWAAKPADHDHPYGHGRFETLTGFCVGIVLFLMGIGICVRSLQNVGTTHTPPQAYTLWPLLASVVCKIGLSTMKFHYGRKLKSAAIIADAWNDSVDILSALAAMTAVGLTLYDPSRFLAADHYGGFAVGIIVILTGMGVTWDTGGRLSDVMPPAEWIRDIREVAGGVPGVHGVEKCYARNTGFQYHVELHLEVDPAMSVLDSHALATTVRFTVRERLDWVADVLVHVEPAREGAPRAHESRSAARQPATSEKQA